MKKRALVSVSNKDNLVGFCQFLVQNDYEIISTGGTLNFLHQHHIEAKAISQISQFPEILDGRVKTLHPSIHAGLLSIRSNPEHQQQMQQHHLEYIDLVIVNLYPFKQTILKPNVTYLEAIENIDIGGPSMLRSAAKNHRDVTVIVDIEDYTLIQKEITENGNTSLKTRQYLAKKVFQHTAAYDSLIAEYLSEQSEEKEIFPSSYTVTLDKKMDLRYGENPHQKAAFYAHCFAPVFSIPNATQLQGKELSYNNIQDADAALNIIKEFNLNESACVAIKHSNPCGVALGENLLESWQKTVQADATSIFGGIIACNQTIDKAVAEQMNTIFLEVIIAPNFTAEALQIFSTKKNLRLLKINTGIINNPALKITAIAGGILLQEEDYKKIVEEELQFVTTIKPTPQEIKDLLFAWKVAKYVKSNAIVIATNNMTLGIGAGQMNRIGAAKIALEQAKNASIKSTHCVLASDGFFPFSDVVSLANEYGIKAIIQPGGSIKDNDSIEACNQYQIAMAFTSIRHFKH